MAETTNSDKVQRHEEMNKGHSNISENCLGKDVSNTNRSQAEDKLSEFI